MVYRVTRKSQSWYGETIGILILNASYPCVPGNVGNGTTFPFPVRYAEVQGATIDRLLNQRDPELATPFIKTALQLEAEGVKAITGACGFMALFQREVSKAVEIPVLLSSLMQVPFMHQITGKTVGIITANSACLTPDHFASCSISNNIPVAITGMEGQREFREAILEERGTLDSGKIEEEVVGVATDLVSRHKGIGSILLECSDLPPYAHAIQARTGLPVFDFITMITHVHHALAQSPYKGHM